MQDVFNFVTAHQTAFATLAVALLDFAFGVNESWKSNGVLHWVFLQLQTFAGKKPDA